MIFDRKSRIPAKYYNLATWNLFRLELLTQLPWRGKGLMTHPQFRCPGKGIPPMKCSKDGIETLNHPILGRRPDSDVIGIPEFLRGNIQRILEFQDLLFLLETHSKTIWSTFCLKETIQPLQNHETVFSPNQSQHTRYSPLHPTPSSNQSSLNLVPQPNGDRLSTMVLAAVYVQFIPATTNQMLGCFNKTLDMGVFTLLLKDVGEHNHGHMSAKENSFGGCQRKHRFRSEILVGQCFNRMPVQQRDFIADTYRHIETLQPG